jgi:hypothetical protein
MHNNKQIVSTTEYSIPLVDGAITLPRREDCPWWEKASRLYALLILSVFPILVGPNTYLDITGTKFGIFAVLTVLYAAACLVIGILFPPGRPRFLYLRSLPIQRPTLPQLLLLAYLLWAVVCTAASPYKGLWLGQNRYEGLCSMLLYGVVFLLLSFWGEYTNGFTYGLGVMGALAGLMAMPQTFSSTFLYPHTYNYWNSEFLTTIGHQDCVAGIICILLPTLLCGFVVLEGNWRYLCLPALFFMPYIAVFTDVDTAKMAFIALAVLLPFLFQSRKRMSRLLIGLTPVLMGMAYAWAYEGRDVERHFAPGAKAVVLALLAAGFCFLGRWLSRREGEWKASAATVRRWGYGAMLALGAAGLVFLFTYGGDNRLLVEASQLLHGNLTDEAGTFRGYIWKGAMALIAEKPILGGGPGCFMSRFAPFNDGYNAAMSTEGIVVDFAHNDFLNIGVCTGLVGLGLYVAFLVALLLRCMRMVNRCPVLLILVAGILGYLAYSFFVFSIAIVSPLFWVLAGTADKCVRQAAEQAKAEEERKKPQEKEI